jgi:hypothetical protein
MGTQRNRSLVVVLLFTLAAGVGAACGSSDPAPKPLSRKFDDTFLMAIPIDQRKEEIAAKQAYDVAMLEKGKAQADYNESRVQLDVAKNERDAARLDEKSAQSRAKAAKDSADLNRIKESDKETKAATSAREAADKRHEYIVAYRAWLKRMLRYTEHNAYWREAQYELAQAKLAAAHNIQPKGFVLDDYVRQEADRAKRTADYRSKTDRDKQAAMSARSKWLAIQGETDKLLGRPSQFPDPLAPEQVKGVDPGLGAGGYTLGGDSGSSYDQTTQPVQDPTMRSSDDGGESSDDP